MGTGKVILIWLLILIIKKKNWFEIVDTSDLSSITRNSPNIQDIIYFLYTSYGDKNEIF